MNIPSNGYSVGNLSTMTISGTLPYKGDYFTRNGQIRLYTVTNYDTASETRTLLFTWFLKECTIYNNSSVTFIGIDAMAFTSNNYAIGRDSAHQPDTIGTQVQTSATTISNLCGATVGIQASTFDSINNMRTNTNKTTESIKNLLQHIAKHDCVNYYTVCGLSNITLTRTSTAEVTYTDTDYAPLTIGISENTIAGVRVKNDKSVTFSPTPIQISQGIEPDKINYGIYEFGNMGSRANTMEIDTPFVTPDTPKSQFSALLGKSFGTQFSCAKLKVPYNEFFIPMSKITFPDDNRTYYICSADYYLTSLGIYASISGSARAVSDYEYIGKTEKDLRTKMAMEYNYNGTCMTQDGIQFVEPINVTTKDADTDIPAMASQAMKIFGVTSLGDGLFRMGNDIVSSYPLLGTDEDLDNHKIVYKYQPYNIEVTWTEETSGVRTNPHWRRVRNT